MKKLVVITGVVLVVLGGLFWLLLYSVQLANQEVIISLRTDYQKLFWKIVGKSAYTLTVQPSQTRYTYSVFGKYDEIDRENHLLYIVGLDGKEYAFSFQEVFFQSDATLAHVGESSKEQLGLIEIEWQSTRTLAQIRQDIRSHVVALNQASDTLVDIYSNLNLHKQ